MVKKMRPRTKKHIKNITLLAIAPLFCVGIAVAQVPDWGPAPVAKAPVPVPMTQTTKPVPANVPAVKTTATKTTATKTVAAKTPVTKVTAAKTAVTKTPAAKVPAAKTSANSGTLPTFKAPEANQPSPQTVFKAPVKPAVQNVSAEDQSQELVAVDLRLASDISDYGPLAAYSKHLSKAGVLYDADGGTPDGVNSAEARFKDFPSAITLVRVPEKAMASANGGSSWGAYKLFRGTQLLSSGRYLAVWRKEQGVWKIVSELAAGKDAPPPVLPAKPSSAQATGAKENPALPNKKLKDVLGRSVN